MPSVRLDIPQHAPPEVATLWLRFHELQLCHDLDTAFVFNPSGFEAWCRIGDEKSYGRLVQLVEPLKAEFKIDLYPTRTLADPKKSDKPEPPPSLSNNPELLNYLFGSANIVGRLDADRSFQGMSGDLLVKQRIVLFAEDLLNRNRTMRRYAGELPAVAAYGFGESSSPGIRARAAALCRQHAQELERQAAKLEDNLKQAMPSESRRSPKDETSSKTPTVRASPVTAAQHLADAAQIAGRQVYRFIYPQLHTVALTDLKEPSVLQSLRELRWLAADFQQVIRKSAKM